MNKNDSDQSQNEGFHVNQPCIDSLNINEEGKQQKNNKTFEARYIAGCGILRKQPKECLQIVSDIPNRQRSPSYRPAEQHSLQGTSQKTAFLLYNNPNQYSLVYSRYKKTLASGERSAFQNQMNLKFYENSKEDTFKPLKEFDQKSIIQESLENCLIFDSKFQCGNLLSAYRSKKNLNQYTIFMQNDTNTYGYNQWFYFSIKNAKKKTSYTLKIANYRKSYSFFKMGMKPIVFSLKKAREDKEGNGWYRDSSSISYYKSNFTEIGCTPYYTLEITLQFQFDHDYITVSPYAPYSYSRLIKSLEQFQKTARVNNLNWRTKAIAHSLTNTEVPFITIAKDPSKGSQKQNIVIIARQHAGETWSSFLVQEIMKDIVEQKTQYSKWLVENFVLRIFPMVNVDGVIYGNFRCDLAGYDLNRTWKNPFQTIHPQVFAIKAELEKLNQKNGINMCLDLHTHSKEYGAFAYCCVQSQKCRQFPSILSKITPLFRYPACTFGISPQKQSTARASIFHLTKNTNIITIELSGYGFKSKKSPQPHMFSPYHIRIIARAILHGYHCYSSKKEPQILEVKLQGSIGIEPLQFDNSNFQNGSGPITGSDSEPEADEIQLNVRIEKVFPQQFIEDIFINGGKKNKNNSKNFKSNVHQSKNDRLDKVLPKKNKTPQFGLKIKSNKTQSKHPQSYPSKESIQDTIVFTPSPSNKQPKMQPPKYQQPLYKKTGKLTAQKGLKVQPQRPTKPLNLIQFSLKKLPLVKEDKIKPNMNYVMQESFPLVGGFSYIQKEQSNRFDKTFSTYEAMCRPRVRTNSRKIGLSKQKNHKLEQQLPYLCVMSQNKRLLHYQHVKEKLSQAQLQSHDARTFHNSILNGHNRHKNQGNKLKNSNKYPNGDLIARINEEFARYDEFIKTKRHRN